MQKRNEYEWLGGGSVQHAVGLSFAKKHLHLITFQKAQCGGRMERPGVDSRRVFLAARPGVWVSEAPFLHLCGRP